MLDKHCRCPVQNQFSASCFRERGVEAQSRRRTGSVLQPCVLSHLSAPSVSGSIGVRRHWIHTGSLPRKRASVLAGIAMEPETLLSCFFFFGIVSSLQRKPVVTEKKKVFLWSIAGAALGPFSPTPDIPYPNPISPENAGRLSCRIVPSGLTEQKRQKKKQKVDDPPFSILRHHRFSLPPLSGHFLSLRPQGLTHTHRNTHRGRGRCSSIPCFPNH